MRLLFFIGLYLGVLPLCGLAYWSVRRQARGLRLSVQLLSTSVAILYVGVTAFVCCLAASFGKTTYGSRIPSPDEKSYAQQIESDEGALGGAESIVIKTEARAIGTAYQGRWRSVSDVHWKSSTELEIVSVASEGKCLQLPGFTITCVSDANTIMRKRTSPYPAFGSGMP